MEKHLLSKSTFIKGLQCQKALFLNKYHYKLKDPLPPERRAMFDMGRKIGETARQLFPGGADATPARRFDYAEAVEKTQQYIAAGQEVIYEAAFQHERVLAVIDILVKKAGKWYGYEVKSGTRITPTYLWDLSVQYWVISSAGVPLEEVHLVHVNKKYLRKGALEPAGLFRRVPLKEQVLEKQEEVAVVTSTLKEVLGGSEVPEVAIGPQCHSPYDCDFLGHCWKEVPEDCVFDIAGMNKEEQFGLYNAGFRAISEIPDDYELGKPQRLQVDCYRKGEPWVDKDCLKDFLETLPYPICFADFETMMPAIPIFDDTRPFQQTPFQYSIHRLESADSEPQHFEFLAEHGADPRKEFIERFLEDTSGEGPILAYNLSFEQSILSALAAHLPELRAEINERIARMEDLMIPFKERYYYHPEMKGKYSIKNVLPALVPELSYAGLDVGSGKAAMNAFEALHYEDDMFKIQKVREALLEYCKMDTLAMVKIFRVLEEAVASSG